MTAREDLQAKTQQALENLEQAGLPDVVQALEDIDTDLGPELDRYSLAGKSQTTDFEDQSASTALSASVSIAHAVAIIRDLARTYREFAASDNPLTESSIENPVMPLVPQPSDLALVSISSGKVYDLCKGFEKAFKQLGLFLADVSEDDQLEYVISTQNLTHEEVDNLLHLQNEAADRPGGWNPGDEVNLGDVNWRYITFDWKDYKGAQESFKTAVEGLGFHVYSMPDQDSDDYSEWFITSRQLSEDELKQYAESRESW